MENVLKITAKENCDINKLIDSVYSVLKKGGSYMAAEITLNGLFNINEPIQFRSNCTFPITLKGEENTVIDGGWHISGWAETVINGIEAWCVKVDCERAKRIKFDQLFVNGERRFRPIYPSNRFLAATGVKIDGDTVTPVSILDKERDWFLGSNTIQYNCELPHFKNMSDVSFVVNHCWLSERMPVHSIDYKTKIITTTSVSRYAVFPDEGMYFENVFETLKNSGEWYFDSGDNILYYVPVKGETIETADIVIPAIDEFINLYGDFDKGCYVTNKHIRNICFRYSSSMYEYSKILTSLSLVFPTRTSRQAECDVPGCINIRNAKHCSLNNCIVEHIGRYAVSIAEGCSHISIESNTFSDLGTGGVKINGSAAGEAVSGNACYINVTDNHIQHYGSVYMAGIGVIIMHGHHCVIAHNDIHHGEYSAISCGWVWGYEQNVSSHNIIEFNHIHNIGASNLCDMGGIYILGTQPCTVIRNNLIHDIVDREKNGWGIYLDEGSTHVLVEKNIVYNVSTEAMHLHYGKANIISNNIFALADIALLSTTRSESHLQMTVERNIFYSNNGNMVRVKSDGDSVIFDKNIYYSMQGDIAFCKNNYSADMSYMLFAEWQKTGNDIFSANCDPLFLNAVNSDFTLQVDSPAYKIGFKDIELTDVGIRKLGVR